jgi:pyruvate,orthophosphate dikinase
VVLKEGEWVSINGTTGEVIKGQQPVKKPGLTGDLATFMKWVDAKRRLKVLTNADTPEDAKVGGLFTELSRQSNQHISLEKRESC